MPKPHEEKAKFKHTIMMPFNTCEKCKQQYIILNVREVHDDWSEEDFHAFEAWMYQECTICPYCGYDSSEE
jgi:hypothetical protein